MAELIISVSGANRTAYVATDTQTQQELEHYVTLTSETETLNFTFKAGTALEVTLSPGNWNVRVDSYERISESLVVYATGTIAVTLKPGLNKETVDMFQAFQITFDKNGGDGEIKPLVVKAGDSVTLPNGSGFSRDGYAFDSWNTVKGGMGTKYATGSAYTTTKNNKGVTLYAQWVSTNNVTFSSVAANGNNTTTTTQLTLTFSKAITGLSASDITLSGVSGVIKGTLSGSNPYTLPISGFTSGGTLNVAVAKSGYIINGSPKTVVINYNAIVEMVQIPGGSFQMGEEEVATTVHTVTLTGFYMGKYQVTQEQWTAVMGSNPSDFTSSLAIGEAQGKRPVECVSWYDALVFCNKLSMMEGLSPAYRISGSTDPVNWGNVPTSANNTTWDAVVIVAGSDGYRLPTEAQWEYAARGGNGSPGNYTYSGSNTVDDVAWYYDNSGYMTHEVGKKAANGLDLYDMSGNVHEWCWDWYGSYTSGAQTDPVGASSGSHRVLRGGAWGYPAESTRSTYRGSYYPDYGGIDIGFRLVRP